MGMPDQINDIIQKHLNVFAAWPMVVNKYSLGDFGLFIEGVFHKMGNIKDDFGISFQEEAGEESSIDFTSEGASVVKIGASAGMPSYPGMEVEARIQIEFTKENSLLVKSPTITVTNIKNIDELSGQLKKQDGWDRQWTVIHQLYNAQDAVIVSTIEAGTTINFSGDITALERMNLGSAGVNIETSKELDLKIQGMNGVIGLGLFKVKSKLFGGLKAELLAPKTKGDGEADILPPATVKGGDIEQKNSVIKHEDQSSFRPEKEQLNPVLLGASAPSKVRPKQEFTARFVAYKKELETEMMSKLKNLSPTANTHLGLKECIWKIGTRVKVALSGKSLKVEPEEDEFIWNGTSNIVDFDVSVPEVEEVTTTVLKFNVSIDNIIVARLRIDLDITSELREERRNEVITEPIRTAFASYATQDRLRVLDRVAEIQRNGIDVFLDCMSIHPGEEWKPRLEKEIKERETFLLFWSSYAMQSQWVAWEWKTALTERGLKGIEPHPLESPSQAPPPEELSALHFNDVYMMIRKANEP